MKAVYKEKTKCCGCGACESICPRSAITMKKDKYGFFYPNINEKKCIDCRLCEKNCTYFNLTTKNYPLYTFAAQSKSDEQLKKSASGGIFAAIAEKFISDAGVVCGCAMDFYNGEAYAYHTIVKNQNELSRLQGSKYMQSRIECYKDIQNCLEQGLRVLFTGTPCQVAQIKTQFDKYKNQLFCLDIVCHGIPSNQMFNDYLKCHWNKKKILNFNFRDKRYGWGKIGSVKYQDLHNKIVEKKIYCYESSFYEFFMESEISRDCCYFCPYTTKNRVGDATIGDYWGIDEFDAELLSENGGKMHELMGVSCILVNTEKGYQLIESVKDNLYLKQINLDHVLVHNHQLTLPPVHTNLYHSIRKIYEVVGYRGIEFVFEFRRIVRRIKGKMKFIFKI